MANTKKTKSKKNDLFDTEEFTIDEQQEPGEDRSTLLEEPNPEDIIDIPPEELEKEEPIEDIESLADSIGAVDEDGNILAAHRDPIHEKEDIDDVDNDTEDEISDSSVILQRNTVKICPHCNEEVLDLEICPLCGNPLSQGLEDSQAKDPDSDSLILDFDDEEYSGKTSSDSRFDEKYEELFDDLPYQDKY